MLKDRLGLSKSKPTELNTHLAEAISWLTRAQDATPDDGFARAYNLLTGWAPSYPETTGYIIPTLIDFYHQTKNEEILRRALKAADWLLEQQFPEGGIPGGTVATMPKKPTIFNTGQVIFGWVSAYKESGEVRYKDAVDRACHWLYEAQDENGTWTKHGSVVATYGLNTYNVRTAWAMMRGGEITGNENYIKAALKNIDWALTQRNKIGWFENNCLTDNNNPLTHTIAYTIRGILECGLAASRNDYIAAAAESAREVLKLIHDDGYLAGRFDNKWNAAADYSCLTGTCQMSIIWSKLSSLGKGKAFLDGAKRALNYVCSTQNVTTEDLNTRGGIKGSYPIDGQYGKFEYLNWAAKFFSDAVMEFQKASGKQL
ncbi:MAG: pectate lyase [Candidatus Zixiibacteriota bacterium]